MNRISLLLSVLDWLEGTHTVEGTRHCWSIWGPNGEPPQVEPCDTVFTTELELINDEGSLIAKEPFSGMDQFHQEWGQSNNDNTFQYLYELGAFSSKVMLDVETDSIFIDYCACGNGGGTKWTFKGKRE